MSENIVERIEQIKSRIEQAKQLPEEKSVTNKIDLMEIFVFFKTKYKENQILLNTEGNEDIATEDDWDRLEILMPKMEKIIKEIEFKIEDYYLD